MSRCISSHGEYGSHELTDSRCKWCRVWECPKCGEDEPYPLDGDDHDCHRPDSPTQRQETTVADNNVTELYPAPSIPNPLFDNPWARLSDVEIAESIIASRARAAAAEHTARSLERELIRRHPDSPGSETDGGQR